MRLLHVTTVPSTLRFLTGQVRYMGARGCEVHALSTPGKDLTAFGRAEEIPVHGIQMLRRIAPFHDLGAVARVVGLLRRLSPAIVHAHTPKGGLLGMLAAWVARVPVRIYHIHGLPFVTATGLRRRLLIASERMACALANQVLCVSRSVAELAVEAELCPAAKIGVIRAGSINGVDAAGRFNPQNVQPDAGLIVRQRHGIPGDARVLGFVGRIVRDKGIAELGGAWSMLREEYPDLHLLLVGPVEDQDPIPEPVEATLRSDPRVHFAGMDWETPPFYSVMDVLVLPTYREGLPVVPLEAAAMELPVVATLVPGCVDAVSDRVTGTLVPAKDAHALAAALRCYLDDPGLRRRHGVAGRERVVREFRQEVIWEATFQEYCRLLRERGVPLPAASAANIGTMVASSGASLE